MKILITGANGFLGQHLTLFLCEKGFDVIASGRGENRIPRQFPFFFESFDLADIVTLNEIVLKHQPDVIIHNAAMSKPDECENDKQKCLLQNVETTRYLINAGRLFQPHFIYISTDFIFGENGPHAEEEKPEPLNFYGESKLMSEQLVKSSGLSYAIVRPVFMYGPVWEGLRPSFLHWVKSSLEQGRQIKVVRDQQRTPTYVYDICKGIYQIIQQKSTGSFHLAGKDILSPYQMAVSVAEEMELNKALIENVTSETFPEPVKRAKRSGLLIDKSKKVLGYDPVSFSDGVRLTFLLPNQNLT